MKRICISLGGSLLSGKDGFNTKYVAGLTKLIKKEKNTGFIIVCGGGHYARAMIRASRDAGVSNNLELDKVGMEATRMNALVLRVIFHAAGIDVVQQIPKDLDELRNFIEQYRVLVCGGFVEGITTDTDAALAAELAGCNTLVNISKLSYVYDKDPNRHKDAKKQVRLTYAQLVRIANENDNREPGSNVIFDGVAASLVARSKIKVKFVGGDVADLSAAIHDRPHRGTSVG